MPRPRTGPQHALIGCATCGWHMQITLIVEIVGETDTHWKCESYMDAESRALMHVMNDSHIGPIGYVQLDEDQPDFNLKALGLIKDSDEKQEFRP